RIVRSRRAGARVHTDQKEDVDNAFHELVASLGSNVARVFGEERSHLRADLSGVRLECEVTRVEQHDLRARVVTPVRLGASRPKKWVVRAPNGKRRRLMAAEEFLKLRIERDVAAVVEAEIELRLRGTRTRHEGDVEEVAVGSDELRIGAVEVLNVADHGWA